MIALFAATALAQEAPPPEDPEVVYAAWRQVDHNGRTLAKVGLAASVAGPPILLVGFGFTVATALSGDGDGAGTASAILLTGAAATLAGPPMLAAGGLRSRKALAMMSGTWTPGVAGYATWGLWGLSFSLLSSSLVLQNAAQSDVAGTLAIAGTVAYGSAIAAGVGQLRTNADARAALRVGVLPAPNGITVVVAF